MIVKSFVYFCFFSFCRNLQFQRISSLFSIRMNFDSRDRYNVECPSFAYRSSYTSLRVTFEQTSKQPNTHKGKHFICPLIITKTSIRRNNRFFDFVKNGIRITFSNWDMDNSALNLVSRAKKFFFELIEENCSNARYRHITTVAKRTIICVADASTMPLRATRRQ